MRFSEGFFVIFLIGISIRFTVITIYPIEDGVPLFYKCRRRGVGLFSDLFSYGIRPLLEDFVNLW